MDTLISKKEFVTKILSDYKIFKLGNFVLKSGITSPFYIDFRPVVSNVRILEELADLAIQATKSIEFDYVVGVPYTALPIASIISYKLKKPLLIVRKETKDYGCREEIVGNYIKGNRCLLIDDVFSTGESKREVISVLKRNGLIAEDVFVFVRRSLDPIKDEYTLHYFIDMNDILLYLDESNCVDKVTLNSIKEFVSFTNRKEYKGNKIQERMKYIKSIKFSPLIASLDMPYAEDILTTVKSIAPLICGVKIHSDLIKDFNRDFYVILHDLSKKEQFFIIDDKKFSDIGNIVKKQCYMYEEYYKNYVDTVTCHAIAGKSSLDGLISFGIPSVLLLARMSTKNNFITDEYTQKVINLGMDNDDVVIGYIGHGSDLKEKVQPIGQMVFTPGVSLSKSMDHLGQSYVTVEEALENGSDFIIMGRSLFEENDPVASCIEVNNKYVHKIFKHT